MEQERNGREVRKGERKIWCEREDERGDRELRVSLKRA
jgi:hypothetical protein